MERSRKSKTVIHVALWLLVAGAIFGSAGAYAQIDDVLGRVRQGAEQVGANNPTFYLKSAKPVEPNICLYPNGDPTGLIGPVVRVGRKGRARRRTLAADRGGCRRRVERREGARSGAPRARRGSTEHPSARPRARSPGLDRRRRRARERTRSGRGARGDRPLPRGVLPRCRRRLGASRTRCGGRASCVVPSRRVRRRTRSGRARRTNARREHRKSCLVRGIDAAGDRPGGPRGRAGEPLVRARSSTRVAR